MTEESLFADFEDSEETWTPLSPAVVQTRSDRHNTDQVAKKILGKNQRREQTFSKVHTTDLSCYRIIYTRVVTLFKVQN